jgi:enterochelin esterase family protein
VITAEQAANARPPTPKFESDCSPFLQDFHMKNALTFRVALALAALAVAPAWAQQAPPADDFKPASTNILGQQYPQVNSARQVRFRITAPQVQTIRVMGTNLVKGEDGVFTGTTAPQDPGFHAYQLAVDGLVVADPASESFFSGGKMTSAIEIPEQGVDFYDNKDVPHGEIRAHWYKTKSGDNRQAWVYTPPDYDQNPSQRYPVLYLQHGMLEERRAWAQQGRTNFILDNLIAEKKAVPMIVVMEDGGISQGMGGPGGGGRGGAPRGGRRGPAAAPATSSASAGGGASVLALDGQSLFFVNAPGAAPAGPSGEAPRGGRAGGARGGMSMPFTSQIINDIIPEMDAEFRTIPDRDHRAMAGLSLGGTQTYQITQANKDKFGYVGIFSAPFGFPGISSYAPSAEEFDKTFKVFFISMGSKEGAGTGRDPANQLKQAGVAHVIYYEAPGTAHEFQTWRKSLHEFAPLLFRN